MNKERRNESRPRAAYWIVATVLVLTGATQAAAGFGDCSQPISSGGMPVATDCLCILRASVALETCTPGCLCAPKGSLPTTATDSLMCLRRSVGRPVTLDCPCVATTTTFNVTTTTLYDPDACGNVGAAPQCFGMCPAGETCLHSGPSCYCGPSTTPCASANKNKCNGICAAGSYCDRSGNACICVTP